MFIYLLLEAAYGILQIGSFGGGTNHLAHLGGALVGFFFFIEDYVRRLEVPVAAPARD